MSPGPDRRPPGRLRIIGGRWKRTPIPVPDLAGLRPTPERVRETLFNWLGQELTGWRVLDLFAGSGALGLEAASRGAAHVVMVERDPVAVKAIRLLCERLKASEIEVVQARAGEWLAQRASAQPLFDLILIDPPFGGPELGQVLPLALERLSASGWIYIEWGMALQPGDPPLAVLPGLEVFRSGRAGQVHYHLLRRAS